MSDDVSPFAEPVSSLYRCNDIMAQNVDYVLKELRTLSLPKDLLTEIETAFRDFGSTLYDVKKEIHNLEYELGMHPSDGSFASPDADSDPKVTIGLIRNWVDSDAVKLDKMVRKLWAISDQNGNQYVLAVALVTESVKNILQAQAHAKRELDRLALR